ncbi:lipopolysaccharide biosynthesis protein [Marinivivus vitaminiproducens]|nr:lipopolysaccharide biosynthesis protein [Geminicoccaceae bacterium SCSIO 64248]
MSTRSDPPGKEKNPSRRADPISASEVSTRAARGGAVIMASQALRFALQIGSTMVLARLLAPEDFGLVAMAGTLTALFTLFADLGLSQATIQREDVTQSQLTTLFWVNTGVGALLAVLCFALAPLVAWFYGDERLIGVIQIMSAGFVLAGLSTQHGALLNRWLRFRTVATIGVAASLFSVLLALALAWLGADYWALVGQQLGLALGMLVGNWMAARWKPGRPQISADAHQMLRFGGDMTIFNLLIYCTRNADNILLGWRHGNHTLGLYERPYALVVSLPLRLINFPLANVMVPALSRLQNAPEGYRDLYLSALEKIGMATLPTLALLALLAEPLVLILLGDGWTDAIPVFFWLAIAAIGQPVGNAAGWLFVSQGRTGEQLLWGVFSSVVFVAGFAAGLPWGAAGVAMAYAITTLVMVPVVFAYIMRRGPVRFGPTVRALVPGLSGTLVVVVLVEAMRLAGLMPATPILAVLVAGIVAAAGMLAIYVAMPTSRRTLREVWVFAYQLARRRAPAG